MKDKADEVRIVEVKREKTEERESIKRKKEKI